jgi:gas vesicle protein
MQTAMCADNVVVLLSTALVKLAGNATGGDQDGIYPLGRVHFSRGFGPWQKRQGMTRYDALRSWLEGSCESKHDVEEKTMADESNSNVGGFAWFLAGLGIGALVGVLYAPKSGKETRDDLVASALEARDKANKLYAQGKEQANEYVKQGRETMNQYVDKGKEYYDKGRTQWSQYVDKGKDLIQTHSDAVSAAVDAGKQAYVQKTSDTPQA